MASPLPRLATLSLVGLALGGVVALVVHGPIPQPDAYHAFADARPGLGIPTAADVLSNLGFLVVGIAGLRAVVRARRDARAPEPSETRAFACYAAGIAVTAVGSVVYHLDPTNASLVFDRLPMTFAFCAFATLVVGERVSARAGRRALVPLLLAGVGSVLAWAVTLQFSPGGDLRAYAFVKYAIPAGAVVLLLAVPEPRATRAPIVLALVTFALATGFELGDGAVFRATEGAVSGHTVKHLVASLAAAFPLGWFARRRDLRAGLAAGR